MQMLTGSAVTVRCVQRIRVYFKGHVAAVAFSGVLCVEAVLLLLFAQGVRGTGLALLVGVGLVWLVCGHGGLLRGMLGVCVRGEVDYMNPLYPE
jgi:hypothetical protein